MRPFNAAFRERFADLLAEMSLALGKAGEQAAIELAREQDALDWPKRPVSVAAWAIARHAAARGATIDPRWDGFLAKMFRAGGPMHNPKIEERLLATLPVSPPRASAPDALIVSPPKTSVERWRPLVIT